MAKHSLHSGFNAMNHKQLLNHVAAAPLVLALDDDVSRLVSRQMLGPSPVPHDVVQQAVTHKLFRRWNCVFEAADDEVTENYRDKAWIVAATTLHKYGLSSPHCTERAVQAIDRLNEKVALSDSFFRRSDEAKNLLRSAPIPLKRRPSVPDDVTFWRAGDVVSYQLDRRYHALYVHEIQRGNTVPRVEFFDLRLDRKPVASDLTGLRAAGGKYNDGVRRIEQYAVYGMRNHPDMANQFVLVQAGWNSPPLQDHLEPAVGLYSVIDIFELQNQVDRTF